MFTYLKTLSSVQEMSLKLLTYKWTMLIALIQASRCQSLQLLFIDGFRKEPDLYILQYNGSLKQSRPGVPVRNVILKQYIQIGGLGQKSCFRYQNRSYSP